MDELEELPFGQLTADTVQNYVDEYIEAGLVPKNLVVTVSLQEVLNEIEEVKTWYNDTYKSQVTQLHITRFKEEGKFHLGEPKNTYEGVKYSFFTNTPVWQQYWDEYRKIDHQFRFAVRYLQFLNATFGVDVPEITSVGYKCYDEEILQHTDPIPAEGCVCQIFSSFVIKIGDGQTPLSELPTYWEYSVIDV